tara:strand:- start:218 stop:598 length:381 start_codon:yes stop_codon:yes gene_type:complete
MEKTDFNYSGGIVSMNFQLGVMLFGIIWLTNFNILAKDKLDVSTLYKKNCSMCHKADGKGLSMMKTPDFTNKKWQNKHSDEQLIKAISKGSGTGQIKMPAFGEGSKKNFSAEQIKALVAMIRNFAK